MSQIEQERIVTTRSPATNHYRPSQGIHVASVYIFNANCDILTWSHAARRSTRVAGQSFGSILREGVHASSLHPYVHRSLLTCVGGAVGDCAWPWCAGSTTAV